MSGLALLTVEQIDSYREHLAPFIEGVCARSRGRYLPEHVFRLALIGDWQFWVFTDERGIAAVCGTEVVQFPTGLRSICIKFGTGRNREQWQHHMGDVIAWGKAVGCGMAEGAMRKGWRRVLPGWSHTHDYLECSL